MGGRRHSLRTGALPRTPLEPAGGDHRRRRGWVLAFKVVGNLLGLAISLCASPAFAQGASLSLTFDDSHASHMWAAAILSSRGMAGTFYVNSTRIGAEGYLRRDDLLEMEAQGHEIGGHTLSHLALENLDLETLLREICDDRFALMSMGLSIRSLAYPFNSHGPKSYAAAEKCGYVSGRTTSGIATPRGCKGCPRVETVPPRDPIRVRSFPSFNQWMEVEDLQDAIQLAILEGGWLVLTFHDLCEDECASSYSMPKGDFIHLVDWLAHQDVEVRTVSEVAQGSLLPPIKGPLVLPQRKGKNLLRNPHFEESSDGDGLPDCWSEGGHGDRRGHIERVEGPSGAFQRLVVSSLDSGDHKLLSSRGPCAPGVSPGQRFVIGIRHSTQGEARLVAYYRTSEGDWIWWSQGPPLPRVKTWTWSRWITPPLPPGAESLQVGLSLRSVGHVDTDFFYLEPVSESALPSSCTSTTAIFISPFLAFYFTRLARRR